MIGLHTRLAIDNTKNSADHDKSVAIADVLGLASPGEEGGGGPVPFLGADNPPWSRRALGEFSWIARSNLADQSLGLKYGVPSGLGAPLTNGIHYVPGDTITLAGGTGTAAVLTVHATQVVSAAIVNAGSSGTPGRALVIGTTGDGNPFPVFGVTIGDDGKIASIDSIQPGFYDVNPDDLSAEPFADASSSGITGAVFSLVLGIQSIAASPAEGSYSVFPTNPVLQASSSGVGTGATFDLFFNGDAATAVDQADGLPLLLHIPQTATLPFRGVTWPITAGLPWTVEIAFQAGGGQQPTLLFMEAATNRALSLGIGDNGAALRFFDDITVPPPTFTGGFNAGFEGFQIGGTPTAPFLTWIRASWDGTRFSISTLRNGSDIPVKQTDFIPGAISTIDTFGIGNRGTDAPLDLMLWHLVPTA